MRRKIKLIKKLVKTKNPKLLKEIISKNYSCVDTFIIFGAPARKDNQRQFTGAHFVLGKSAMQYVNLFEKQIKRLKTRLAYPYNFRDYIWVFEIFYNRKDADASIELIFDLMQKYDIIEDDVNIRQYIVLADKLDKEVPRLKVTIYK